MSTEAQPEVWQPIMAMHPMSTDEAMPQAQLPRPMEGRCNVRVLITDETGAVAGMDAGNVSAELAQEIVGFLIREHAADVKRILATETAE